MIFTPSTGDDTAAMFLPGAIIQSCASCILQCRVRLHRAVNNTIPQNKRPKATPVQEAKSDTSSVNQTDCTGTIIKLLH